MTHKLARRLRIKDDPTDSLSVTPILLKPENLKLIEIKGVFLKFSDLW
jgi:hypothetical protein